MHSHLQYTLRHDVAVRRLFSVNSGMALTGSGGQVQRLLQLEAALWR